MAKTLFFPHAFTLGLGPGRAAAIRAADVIRDVPDDLVVMLKARFGASDVVPDGSESVELKRRLLDDDAAARLSHPLVEKRLKPTQTELLAAAIKDLAAAQSKA